MLTSIEVSDEFYKVLQLESERTGLSVDLICEKWARIGQRFEKYVYEEGISIILDTQPVIEVVTELCVLLRSKREISGTI